MARVDEDGYFFIVDRKKEMIIRGGYNVYPREIEEVLYEHPAVSEAAVIGVADEALGEEVGGGDRPAGPGDDADRRRDPRVRQGAGRRLQVPARRSGSSTSFPKGADGQDPQARDRRAPRAVTRLDRDGERDLRFADGQSRSDPPTTISVAMMAAAVKSTTRQNGGHQRVFATN